MLTKEFLKDAMSTPSCSGHEQMMRAYVMDYAAARGIGARADAKGNVYLTKGTLLPGEKFVCLANHMDTVHEDQRMAVASGRKLTIVESEGPDGATVLRAKGTGIGADDKLGCAIALAILARIEKGKAVFFVEEEWGMRGSKELDADWFSDVSFCLSFDSPGRNRSSCSCAGVALYPDSVFRRFIRPIASKHGVTNFNYEPYTDVVQIRRKTGVPCYNVGNGGCRAHCPDEYLVVEDAQESYALGLELLEAVRAAAVGFGDGETGAPAATA